MTAPAQNNKGFSLIELLIATMLIMVSMLALLTMMISATNTNQSNEIRNTAIIVANQTAEAILALPISDLELTDGAHSRTASAAQSNKGFPEASQKIRGYMFSYTITWQVTTQSKDLKVVNIAVSYTDRGQARSYSAVIYKHSAV